jgi:hypothetical protein
MTLEGPFRAVVCAVAFGATTACAAQPATIPFRSLEATGTGSFVCLTVRDGDVGPRSMQDCPDVNPVDDEFRQTYSLVTQPNRGEIAVIAVNVVDTGSGKAISGGVIDQEPAVPGFNFLPVGARPVDIVSSPGSAATFVAASEVGKEGIYALPSSCILRRNPNATGPDGAPDPDPVRDISLWPACQLPATPGKMTMLIDRAQEADGSFRKSCPGTQTPPDLPDTKAAQDATSCFARVDEEAGPEGRRKLLVSLPELGEVVVIDAQSILDRPQGSFQPCVIERRFALEGAITPIEPIVQKLPPDLDAVYPNGLFYPPPPEEGYAARPAGFARLDDSNEHKLFIADSEAPVIHRLDTTDPCAITELPPLLPLSYFEGGRTVTTTKVAVMDRLTSDGKRFLYAIDQVGGGQVMIFDVSPDSVNRTPIVRERSPFMPFEAPDRLAITAPAVDVAFVTQNSASAADPATGTETVQACDPTPPTLPHSPGTVLQPTLPDYSFGARPSQLRGTFGLVALSSGFLTVIDVEDLDKPCRRPSVKNTETVEENFRGCAPDNVNFDAFTKDGLVGSVPTVTDEVSCQVVQRHRARSSNLVLTNSNFGPRAPSIRVLPRLIDKDGRGLLTDESDTGREHPKMLGVNFRGFDAEHPQNRAQVFVGTDLFATPVNAADNTARLEINPAKAGANSVVLSLAEPRSYGGDVEDLTATYEGTLLTQPAGVVAEDAAKGVWTLRDTTVNFCFAGVESSALFNRSAEISDQSSSKYIGIKDRPAFEKEYADHVVVTGQLLPETDSYWQSGNRGSECNGASPDQPGAGFIQCRVLFGNPVPPNEARKFRIKDAARSVLTIEPKEDLGGATAVDARLRALACCFPEPFSYTVRASKQWLVTGGGALHPIVAGGGPDFECHVDPNPLFKLYQNRVYEVACNDQSSPACLEPGEAEGAPPRAIIGPEAYDDPNSEEPDRNVLPARACIIDNPQTDMQTIGTAVYPGCMFVTNQSNFVIYRGTQPSEQDMKFQWTIVGGFTPQVINMSLSNDANTQPQSILRSPFNGTVMVADGGSKGLVVVDLASFGPYPIN